VRILSLGRRVVHGVAYSADGRFLISLNSGSQIRFWDVPAGTPRSALTLPETFSWAPGDQYGGNVEFQGTLLAYRNDVWNLRPTFDFLTRAEAGDPPDPPCVHIPIEKPDNVTTWGVTTDGRILAGLTVGHSRRGNEGGIRVWDLEGRCRRRFPTPAWIQHSPALAVAPDGTMLAIATSGPSEYIARTLALFDLESGELIARLAHTDTMSRVRFSTDGRLVATAAGRSTWLWDVASRTAVRRFPAFRRHAASIAFSLDGRLFGAGGRDGAVRLWDTATCREVVRFDWRIGEILGLAFSPNGQTAAAAGRNGKIVIWDLE